MDDPRTLGQIIRARRQELGLTQEQLAALNGGGVRQAEVSRLEGHRITLPRRQRLERIATALGVTIGELLVGAGWAGADVAFRRDHEGSVPSEVSSSFRDDRSVARAETSDGVWDGSHLSKLQEALAHSHELRMRTAHLLEVSAQLATAWSMRGTFSVQTETPRNPVECKHV